MPGDGLPIVLMADRQPTGGYPKIATGADLGRLAQAQAGSVLHFASVSLIVAVAARRAEREALAEPVVLDPGDPHEFSSGVPARAQPDRRRGRMNMRAFENPKNRQIDQEQSRVSPLYRGEHARLVGARGAPGHSPRRLARPRSDSLRPMFRAPGSCRRRWPATSCASSAEPEALSAPGRLSSGCAWFADPENTRHRRRRTACSKTDTPSPRSRRPACGGTISPASSSAAHSPSRRPFWPPANSPRHVAQGAMRCIGRTSRRAPPAPSTARWSSRCSMKAAAAIRAVQVTARMPAVYQGHRSISGIRA